MKNNVSVALKVNILTEKFSFEIENCPFEDRRGRIKHPASCDLSSYGAWSSYQSKHCPGFANLRKHRCALGTVGSLSQEKLKEGLE